MGKSSKVVFQLFGILDVTGEVITMWIILAVLAIVSLIIRHNLKERPGVFQNMVETGVEYLDNFFTDLLGKKKARDQTGNLYNANPIPKVPVRFIEFG